MAEILIIDDDSSIRKILERTLARDGYRCSKASDASMARKLLERASFKLALVDVNMPGESGLDFVQYARKTFPDMPAIMITGADDNASIDSAIEAGVYSYLLKPFEPRQMLLEVRNALRHRETERANRQYRENLEKMLAEKMSEVKTSEEKFRAISSCAHDGIVMIDDQGNIAFWNEAAEKMFGYARDEAMGTDLQQLVAPLHGQQAYSEAFSRFRTSQKGRVVGETLELGAVRKDGLEIPVELSLSAGGIGGKWHVFGIFRDVSARKAAEENLRKSEEQYRTLIEAAQEGVAVSKEGIQVFVNNKFAEMFGYESADELVGKENLLVVHPDDKERLREIIQKRAAGEDAPTRYEFKGMRKDGQTVYVAVAATHTTYLGEKVDIAFLMDFTELKTAQENLEKAHAKTKQLVAAISSILIVVDRENRIMEWNPVAERTFGLTREQVLGKTLVESGIKWEGQTINNAVEECKNNGQICRIDDIRFNDRDSKDHFLGMSVSPVMAYDSTATGILISAADITERKLLESQLIQAQKLESIGQLAAGIAHEINTPTQYVGDNTRFLKEGFEDLDRLLEAYQHLSHACQEGNETEEALKHAAETAEEIDLDYLRKEIPAAIEQSLEGVERVAKIVRAMKEFSHPGNEEKTPTDINKAIENTVTVARNEWKYVADMTTDFDGTLPSVPCLPAELNQVFLNMIVNAAHAVGEATDEGSQGKGTITLRTRKNGEWAEIMIEDTGTGIPREMLSKIFDPFFTTKEVGKGTGQGLNIAHNVIVEKHKGRIDVESEVGKGTTFTILLPLENRGT